MDEDQSKRRKLHSDILGELGDYYEPTCKRKALILQAISMLIMSESVTDTKVNRAAEELLGDMSMLVEVSNFIVELKKYRSRKDG